ncbi:MAG: hypothetical protein ACJ73S_18060 [Mycobacteriales bacterium]
MAAHRPARTEAANAQGAAKPPADDKLAQGKVAQAGEMDAAKPGGFDKAAFVKAVNDAIASQAPKNLDEADKFAESGKADHVKSQVQGKVSEGKKASAGQIESTTKAAPDTSKAIEKPVTPLSPDQPPPTPAGPNPGQAVPDKAPPEATDFSAGPRQVDNQMDQAQVTDAQLANSNEPEFTDALKAKKEGEKHAATAPPQLRASEDKTLTAGKQQAAAAGQTAMSSMALHGKTAGAQVHAGKQSTQTGDEARRAAATAKLQAVFDATRTEVEGILSGLDRKVDEQFTSLEGEARKAFTAEHKQKMDAYKHKRYSGFTGKLRWVKDKFAGLPEEANQIFVAAKAGYTARMQQVISTVADTIAAELNRAKARIAKGKAELAAEVKKLPADLQAMGKQAAAGFDSKFAELTEQVDSKGTELVNTLASKYTEALKSVDAEIEAEKEKNKGLIAKAIGAVKGVIDTILKLKDLLLGILAKAAAAVMKILKDPIGFLSSLVHAVGAGLKEFIANIGEHLKKGLVSWLLGAAAQAGLAIPAKFDLKGILSLIGGLLGLTWNAIRGRVVSKGIPDQAITAAEKAVPEAEALQKEGLPGLWQRIQAKIGNLKDMILGKLAAFLIPTVLIAGITWIISLLNPASAFVKACKAIIDIVTFIVERGAQIIAFVNAVLDAVIAIAAGGAGGVPALIVGALAASIPVLIGFLAALLGVGGIADKVKKVFQAVAKPVMKVVDWVVDKIVGLAKKFWAKLKNKFGKKDKDSKGKGDVAGPGMHTVTARVTMSGVAHTVTIDPSGPIRMASREGGLREKVRARLAVVEGQPQLAAEAAALRQILEICDEVTKAAKKSRPQAENPAWDDACRRLVAAVSGYGQRFNKKDIDPDQDVPWEEIVAKAQHVPPRLYSRGKHWQGRSDAERRQTSTTGASQFVFAMTEARVAELERDTLLTGERQDRGAGTYHVWKRHGEQLGWDGGNEAFWLRAELTNANAGQPSVHSHPRQAKG